MGEVESVFVRFFLNGSAFSKNRWLMVVHRS